jgi:hypothetical protein
MLTWIQLFPDADELFLGECLKRAKQNLSRAIDLVIARAGTYPKRSLESNPTPDYFAAAGPVSENYQQAR